MKRFAIAAACALSCVPLTGCLGEADPFRPTSSEYGPNTVFLYFLNGVGGAESMAIRGPSARIARNLAFGERMAVDGRCPEDETCVPVDVDRSDGGTFVLKLDGRRVELDLTDELAAFYPHETGTVIFNGSAASPRATVVRHVQTVSEGCALTVVNALSVANLETRSSGFDVATEYRLGAAQAGYEDESERPVSTRCGELPTDAFEHERLARPRLHARITQRPWFYRTRCDDGGECFRWSESGLAHDGSFGAPPTTAEYRACLADAISVPDRCPGGDLGWQHVTVDESAAEACAARATYSAELTPPGETDTIYGTVACGAEFRVRTPGQDLVFGSDEPEAAHHQDGDLVRSREDVPVGAERFWTLLGRPVEPTTFTWDSSETFVDLSSL